MKKSPQPKTVRGKYANLLKQGSNIVMLDLDLLDSFPDSPSINRALRAFLAINQNAGDTPRPLPPPTIAGLSTFDPRAGLRSKSASR